MELRLVDRLNGALQNKADRAIQEQLAQRVSDYGSRLTVIEQSMVKKDGPIVQRVEAHENELVGLRAITGYKKLIIANTLIGGGLAVGIVGLLLNGGSL